MGQSNAKAFSARTILAALERTTSDAELLTRVAGARDATAFEALVERHAKTVHQTCRSVLNHDSDADDAFQKTFLKLWMYAATIRDPKAVAGWLRGTAWRTAYSLRSASARRREAESIVQPKSDRGDVDISCREALEIVHAEISRLPARLHAVAILCLLQWCTREEAAAALGISTKAAQKRYDRALSILRDRLIRRGVSPSIVAAATGLFATPISADLIRSTVEDVLDAKQLGMAVPWKAMHWSLCAVAGVVVVAGAFLTSTREPAQPKNDSPVLPQSPGWESLQDRNLRLLTSDVLPKVLLELRSIPGAGEVRLVSYAAYDTRVECVIEGDLVRLLSATVTEPVMRLIYDTHDGWKCRLLKFHANGEWTRMDPFDRPLSLLIPLPAVGTLEFEFPVAQFDRAWAAFAAIPADDRMPEAAQARDDALMEFVRPAIGTFVRESNNRPYWIRWDRRLGLMKGGREWRGEFSMMRYDWSATDFQGERQIRLDKQALRIATDGSRMMLADVGNDDGETWLRTEIAAAGEAVKPTANRDLTGLWRHPELDSPVCAILHRPDGRIVLIDAEDKRTYAALNSRNELFAAESGEWATAARGTVDLQFQVLTWMNSDGSSSRWTRSADAAGTLMGIWHRKSNTGSRDRRCIITERARGESGTTCLLIDEWDRRTSAEFANGVLKVKSGPEWGPKHGKASTNGQRIEWDSGVVWER